MDEDQEITSYEMNITEHDELQMIVSIKDKQLICHMKANQAFSFLMIFIATLGRLVTLGHVDGDLSAFFKKGPGGEDPTGGAALPH